MSINLNLELTERTENVREQKEPRFVVHFNLKEIKDRFDERVYNIEKKFNVYDELVKSGSINDAKDILRSQIVFLEGVIDFYLHEMTKYSFYQMFLNEWTKTQQYKNFKVKMEIVEKGLISTDSKEWFFEYVTDSYNRTVFLSYENMHDQLNAIGIPYNDVMHIVFKEQTEKKSADKGKAFITQLFKRRNEIAHQNDRSHDSAIQNDIDKTYVQENIETIKKIAQAIYTIASTK